jgi:hypothetical protein
MLQTPSSWKPTQKITHSLKLHFLAISQNLSKTPKRLSLALPKTTFIQHCEPVSTIMLQL